VECSCFEGGGPGFDLRHQQGGKVFHLATLSIAKILYVAAVVVNEIPSEYGPCVEWNWQDKPECMPEQDFPVPLCPPQIPHELDYDRNRASTVRRRGLTVWTTIRSWPQWNFRWSVCNRSLHPVYEGDWLAASLTKLKNAWSFTPVPSLPPSDMVHSAQWTVMHCHEHTRHCRKQIY
jgi:hypothetical protein